LPQTADITINASGFNLLWFSVKKTFHKLTVDLKENNSGSSGNVTVSLKPIAEKQFNLLSYQNVSSSIYPPAITFFLSKEFMKKVPVKNNLEISFRKQFGLSGKITCLPDSVVFSGPKDKLENISIAQTEIKQLKNLQNETQLQLAIVNPDRDNLFISDDSVTISIPVEELTEETVNVKVQNQPGEKFTVIPDEVTITFRTTLKNLSKISASSFLAQVKATTDKSGKAVVQIVQCPPDAEVVFVNPSMVTCLKKQ
jgi:YbbR domain-containing protein